MLKTNLTNKGHTKAFQLSTKHVVKLSKERIEKEIHTELGQSLQESYPSLPSKRYLQMFFRVAADTIILNGFGDLKANRNKKSLEERKLVILSDIPFSKIADKNDMLKMMVEEPNNGGDSTIRVFHLKEWGPQYQVIFLSILDDHSCKDEVQVGKQIQEYFVAKDLTSKIDQSAYLLNKLQKVLGIKSQKFRAEPEGFKRNPADDVEHHDSYKESRMVVYHTRLTRTAHVNPKLTLKMQIDPPSDPKQLSDEGSSPAFGQISRTAQGESEQTFHMCLGVFDLPSGSAIRHTTIIKGQHILAQQLLANKDFDKTKHPMKPLPREKKVLEYLSLVSSWVSILLCRTLRQKGLIRNLILMPSLRLRMETR